MNPKEWRVLVVEDESDSADLISQLLQHYGARVAVAANGVECLGLVDSFRPTLIIMDLAMPELDGWQTLKHLRRNPNFAHIPVIAVTAFDSEQVAEHAEIAGFDAYYPKPIDVTLFLDQIGAMIQTRSV